jgi:asparagine synthase (glutamine-hydrolysing)
MRLALESGVKVLLDGQGADEMLAGYVRYGATRLGGALRSPRHALGAARAMGRNHGPFRATLGYAFLGVRRPSPRLNRRRMPAAWLGGVARGSHLEIKDPASMPGTLLAKRLWLDIAADNLPDLLRFEDRNSMSHSIEARVPFLDHRLVEASLLLPDRLKVAGPRDRKIVLRRAMAGIVPDDVLQRRDKVAFQSPERRWLLEAAGTWRGLAAQSRAVDAGFAAPGAIPAALERLEQGVGGTSLLWRLLNLELWLRQSAGESPLG